MPEPVTVIVAKSADIPHGTIATTPGSLPNVIIKALNPVWIVLVRALRVYLQTLVGLLSAGATGMAGSVLPAGDFLHMIKVCAGLSLASAIMCALQNTLELLGNIDKHAPELRG